VVRLIVPLCATDGDDAVRFVLGATGVHGASAIGADALRDVVGHAELERIVL
jgi:hypothetical protein